MIMVLLVAILSASAQHEFFPKYAFADDPGNDQFLSDWYSRELRILDEPSLLSLAKDASSESYRFLWLRTFHHPVVIRVDLRADATGILTTKVADGAAGFPHTANHLIENVSRPLSREDTQSLLGRIKKTDFWTLPSHVDDRRGTDGSEWIIEGVKNGKYHVISRWSPHAGGVRKLGLTFALGLAKMKIPTDEVY